jgi:uncharacterized membrane protein YbhN (UPF0104 family)
MLLALLITAAFLYQMDLRELESHASRADRATLILVVLSTVPLLTLVVLRTRLILNRLGYVIPLQVQAPITIVGFVAGSLTPAGTGEVVRVAEMRRQARVSTEDAIALIAFERLLSFVLLLASTIVVASLALLPVAFLAGGAALVATASGASIFLWRRLWIDEPRLFDSDNALMRRIRPLIDAVQRLNRLCQDRALLLPWTALTLGIFATTSLQVWLLARLFQPDLSVLEAWITLGGSQIVAVLSLLPFGLGASDGALALLLSQFGTDVNQGATVAALLRLTSTLPLLLSALASYVLITLTDPDHALGKPEPTRVRAQHDT